MSIDERIGRLPPEKRALLERRLLQLQAEKERLDTPPPIRPRRDRGPTPLSYAQELMWLVQQVEPETVVYNSPGPRRLRGPLDAAALRQALCDLVERHEVLRTVYSVLGGSPVQIVREGVEIDLPVLDLKSLPTEGERLLEVDRIIAAETHRPFDLGSDSVLRAFLLRLGDDDHVLLTVTHHIASDGWSRAVFYSDLAALYEARRDGREPALPPLPVQYADYALWQRGWLSGERLERELAYWRDHLAGAPALLELPTDRPRPPVQSHRGARQSIWLPTPLYEALKAVARRHETSLFMLMLAAVTTLLHRYSGQDEIVLGTPIAGRNNTQVEHLVGYFTNTLALRTDLSGDPKFAELLSRARETTLGAFGHQDAPFERVVAEVRRDRDPSYSPVFQLLFVLQNAMPAPTELAGLQMSQIRVDAKLSKFDMTLGMGEHPEGLHGSFEYATDLFDDDTITRLRANFQTLLEGIVDDPERRLSALPLMSEQERRTVLVDWNTTSVALPGDRCLHELVTEQAARTPAAPAVVAEAGSLTYAELETRAHRLAVHLQRLGVSRDVPVAICAERSPELLVGLLAILMAGGACLPLDPSYPRERLRLMLEDAQPKVLLAQSRLIGSLPGHGAPVVALEDPPPDPAGCGLSDSVRADDLAYLIYTSGSTGEPRGVMLTHRGLVNHATAARELYGFRPDDRVLQFASISFDISIEEIFVTWLAGATLVLRPDEILGPRFLEWLRSKRVTVLDLPTAYWHEWVADLERQEASVPESIRAVIVGGEKPSAAAYARWLRVGGDRCRWFNTYGPTEASVVASVYEPDPTRAVDSALELPMGRPIANTRLYVLDANQAPVPIGVPGELYIGGVGVARGYLGRPELTAERFVPEPFADDPGARVYRTGDVVRQLADGNLVFVGRTDHQVKIRGFRVEPGEVEVVLRRHPAVQDAVVLAREDGEKRLVAYIVSDRPEPPEPEELRSFVDERLPSFMTPSACVVLEALPLTPNGKVDRDALPLPELDVRADEMLLPRTPNAEKVASIWREVLKREAVGVRDDFFLLGGHSLAATQVVARLRESFVADLTLRTIFESPTIEALAAAIDDQDGREGAPELAPLVRVARPLIARTER